MRGADLREARRRLNATHQQIADAVGVQPREVESWELLGAIPRAHRFPVDLVLWELECDQALARSGLPECERVRAWAADPGAVDPETVDRHVEGCSTCEARAAYVLEHVRPQPLGGGLYGWIVGFVVRLNGWKQSAAIGAGVVLMLGGIGVPVLLIRALTQRDARYAVQALGLFAVLAISGAIGGIAYPRRLRSHPPRPYASIGSDAGPSPGRGLTDGCD